MKVLKHQLKVTKRRQKSVSTPKPKAALAADTQISLSFPSTNDICDLAVTIELEDASWPGSGKISFMEF